MQIVVLVIGSAAICACWPRQADLRAFYPPAMARLETAMWRADLWQEQRIGRAEAMAYRDAHGRAMMEQDWAAIETRPLRGYQLLKERVAGSQVASALQRSRHKKAPDDAGA